MVSEKFVRIVCLFVLLLIAGCGGDNGVTPPAPNQVKIFGVTPAMLSLGAQGQPVEITGSGFVSVTSVDLGPGINILSREVPDSGRIQLVVNIGKGAVTGQHNVIVSTPGSTGTLAGGVTVSTNFAPLAKFTVSPTQGTISTTFVFDAGGSTDSDGTITEYTWQVSDGTNPRGMKTQHQFSQKGEYTIVLKVTDNKGGVSTSEQTVTVGDNNPPVAVLTVMPATGTNLTLFTFDASGSSDPDGGIKGYQWDFGDNKTAQGVGVTHKYIDAGDYDVQLTVKDTKNAETIAKKKVHVEFFDVDQARKDITDTITTFLRLFGDFEHYTAEEVVVGFSRSGSCPGREREISIIRTEQQNIRSQGVRGISVEVTDVNEKTGHASAAAEFYGVTNDGQSYGGISTHHMSMTNENGSWLICNFYVTQ
jgi:chitodextrinase